MTATSDDLPTPQTRRAGELTEVKVWLSDVWSKCRDTNPTDWLTFVFVAVFLMLSGAMGNALYGVMQGWLGGAQAPNWAYYLIGAIGFVLLIPAVAVVAKKVEEISQWRAHRRGGLPPQRFSSEHNEPLDSVSNLSAGEPASGAQLSIREQEEIQPYDVLIVALSNLESELHSNRYSRASDQARAANNREALVTFCDDKEFRHFPWQQALRAICSQIKVRNEIPPQIIVAVSKESTMQYADFEKIARGFLAPYTTALAIGTWGNPLDFEEFEDVTKHLEKILKEHRHKTVCIDITGGQKTFSAAATVVTANRKDVMMSYISALPNHGWKPNQYDVVHRKGDSSPLTS
jgi:hypothetical protein